MTASTGSDTGGDATYTFGSKKIHAFTSSGSLVVTEELTVTLKSLLSVEVVVEQIILKDTLVELVVGQVELFMEQYLHQLLEQEQSQ